MKHRKILFAVFASTLLGFGAWFAVLQSVDPFNTDWFSRLTFYIFLLIWFGGSISLILFYMRKKLPHNSAQVLAECVRQGLIISLGVVGLLVLQTINVLNILSVSVYVIALILIEFYFRTKKPNYA